MRLQRSSRMALLADKNPLFVPRDPRFGPGLTYDDRLPETSASPFHRSQGQNVLIGDGHVFWSTRPVLPNGDNIWLAGDLKRYYGDETPAGPNDSFLVP
jgi:hypothetical protein